jgi:hypothetical protein
MAPSDAAFPDAGPFGEYVFERTTMTGRLVGPRGTAIQCVDQDQDENGIFCSQIAFYQRYSTLTRIEYALQDQLVTSFSFSATPFLPPTGDVPGTLGRVESTLSTDEVTILP